VGGLILRVATATVELNAKVSIELTAHFVRVIGPSIADSMTGCKEEHGSSLLLGLCSGIMVAGVAGISFSGVNHNPYLSHVSIICD
jgi:hypothetical protein